jgi:hypothetical protein
VKTLEQKIKLLAPIYWGNLGSTIPRDTCWNLQGSVAVGPPRRRQVVTGMSGVRMQTHILTYELQVQLGPKRNAFFEEKRF